MRTWHKTLAFVAQKGPKNRIVLSMHDDDDAMVVIDYLHEHAFIADPR